MGVVKSMEDKNLDNYMIDKSTVIGALQAMGYVYIDVQKGTSSDLINRMMDIIDPLHQEMVLIHRLKIFLQIINGVFDDGE